MLGRTRTARLGLFAAAGALALSLALVPVAFAGKGGGGGSRPKGGGGTGGSGTISLAFPLVKDVNGDGLPNFGDVVEFNVSTTATTQPYVHLKCFQNGVLVAEGWRGYFVGSLDYPYFGLNGGQWASGAADCTAYLVKGSTLQGWTQLGSTSFHVNA
jgi:hypothetical protein